MIRIKSIPPLLFASVFVCSSVWAAEWVEGYGEDLAEALENSLYRAKAVVARGEGCLGRIDGSDVEFVSYEQGLFVVRAFVSDYQDSCERGIGDEEWIANGASNVIASLPAEILPTAIASLPAEVVQTVLASVPVDVALTVIESLPQPAAGPAPAGEAQLQIRASRLFAGPGEYPPTDFEAYGIVAFQSRATGESLEHYLAICKGFIAGLPSAFSLSQRGVPKNQQMATVWPLTSKSLSKELNLVPDLSQPDRCEEIVRGIDLVGSREMIAKAKKAQDSHSFRGRGPFLLAWSPASTVGQEDAVILRLDLSDVTTVGQATSMFSDWANRIEQKPDLWKQGWNVERLRVRLRLWADKYGPGLLSVLGLSMVDQLKGN